MIPLIYFSARGEGRDNAGEKHAAALRKKLYKIAVRN